MRPSTLWCVALLCTAAGAALGAHAASPFYLQNEYDRANAANPDPILSAAAAAAPADAAAVQMAASGEFDSLPGDAALDGVDDSGRSLSPIAPDMGADMESLEQGAEVVRDVAEHAELSEAGTSPHPSAPFNQRMLPRWLLPKCKQGNLPNPPMVRPACDPVKMGKKVHNAGRQDKRLEAEGIKNKDSRSLDKPGPPLPEGGKPPTHHNAKRPTPHRQRKAVYDPARKKTTFAPSALRGARDYPSKNSGPPPAMPMRDVAEVIKQQMTDTKCSTCLDVMNAMFDLMEDPEDPKCVYDALEEVCRKPHMRKSYPRECHPMVEANRIKMVAMVEDGKSPVKVCAALYNCPAERFKSDDCKERAERQLDTAQTKVGGKCPRRSRKGDEQPESLLVRVIHKDGVVNSARIIGALGPDEDLEDVDAQPIMPARHHKKKHVDHPVHKPPAGHKGRTVPLRRKKAPPLPPAPEPEAEPEDGAPPPLTPEEEKQQADAAKMMAPQPKTPQEVADERENERTRKHMEPKNKKRFEVKE